MCFIVYFDANTFLSTPSARRATVPLQHFKLCMKISIHALREEGDPTTPPTTENKKGRFLSTPSARRATQQPRGKKKSRAFLSTPSARRATLPRH